MVLKSGAEHNYNGSSKYIQNGNNDVFKIQFLMGTYDNSTWTSAVTTISANGYTYIKEADIAINSAYNLANNGGANLYDVQDCMAHEIGHVLGLSHSTDTSATMYPADGPGQTKRHTLEVDDLAGLQYIYR